MMTTPLRKVANVPLVAVSPAVPVLGSVAPSSRPGAARDRRLLRTRRKDLAVAVGGLLGP